MRSGATGAFTEKSFGCQAGQRKQAAAGDAEHAQLTLRILPQLLPGAACFRNGACYMSFSEHMCMFVTL